MRQQEYKEPAWIKKIRMQDQKEHTRAPTQSNSSSSRDWDQPISDSQAIELSKFLLTEAEEQEFLASQETPSTQPCITQESEEAPLSWETNEAEGRHNTQADSWHKDPITDTWYYGPQFPHATHLEQDPSWEEWLAAVTTSPPQDFYYLEKI